MSHDCYPASPLECWLDLQKTHITWSLSSFAWRHHTCASCADTKENTAPVLLTSSLRKLHGHRENTAAVLFAVCVLRPCLSMDLHVTIYVEAITARLFPDTSSFLNQWGSVCCFKGVKSSLITTNLEHYYFKFKISFWVGFVVFGAMNNILQNEIYA
jgi:hypothetical protein